MTVVLTGAGGFVGAAVARALVARGERVIAPIRASTSRARLRALGDRIEIVEIALDDLDDLERLLRRERGATVVHAAWNVNPADYLTSAANLDSLRLTIAVAERAIAAGCAKLVGVGTCFEYAPLDRPLRESDPPGPGTLYASTKHAAWLVARSLCEAAGIEIAWARIFHVYGPGEHPSRLVPAVLRAVRAGTPFALSAGTQIRDFLHVDDVGEAIARIASPGARGPYNVCSGTPTPLRLFLEAIADAAGDRQLLRFGACAMRAEEPPFLVGDPSRLRVLGWESRRSDVTATARDMLAETQSEP